MGTAAVGEALDAREAWSKRNKVGMNTLRIRIVTFQKTTDHHTD